MYKDPSSLDFSHENFKLRSLALLLQVKEGALQEILLSDNALESLTELNRFTALKVLVASRNALVSGPGMRLSCPKLTRLDLSGNQLQELPPGLGALRCLRKLYLQSNRLQSLPADLCAEVGTGGNCVPVRGGTAPGRCEDGGAGLLSGAHAVRLGRLVRLVIDVLVYESSVSILSMSIDSCPCSSSSSTRIGTE